MKPDLNFFPQPVYAQGANSGASNPPKPQALTTSPDALNSEGRETIASTPTQPPRVLNTAGGLVVDGAATTVRTLVGVPPERIKSICHQQRIFPWDAVKQMALKDMYKGIGYAGLFNASQIPAKQATKRFVDSRFPNFSVWEKAVVAGSVAATVEVGVGFPFFKMFFYSADRKRNDLIGVGKHMLNQGGARQFYHGVIFRGLLHVKFNTVLFATMDTVAPWLKDRGWSDGAARMASGFSGAAAGTLANHHMDVLCTHVAVMEPSKNRPGYIEMMKQVGGNGQEKLLRSMASLDFVKRFGFNPAAHPVARGLALAGAVYKAALPALPAKFLALVPSMGAAMGVGSALSSELKTTEVLSQPVTRQEY